MRPILVVVHQATSSPGLVGKKLIAQGYSLDIRCPALGDALPETLSNHSATVIFGGPMSANDDDALDFIRTELDWISVALGSGKPYLGICLGAQLLARVLGGTVSPDPAERREIGYYRLQTTPAGAAYLPASMMVYQWHREGFTLPTHAVKLAVGETFPNQAFRYGKTAFGFQFHPEITHQLIEDWTTRAGEQLLLPGAQPRSRHFDDHERHGRLVDHWLEHFLKQWLEAEEFPLSQSA